MLLKVGREHSGWPSDPRPGFQKGQSSEWMTRGWNFFKHLNVGGEEQRGEGCGCRVVPSHPYRSRPHWPSIGVAAKATKWKKHEIIHHVSFSARVQTLERRRCVDSALCRVRPWNDTFPGVGRGTGTRPIDHVSVLGLYKDAGVCGRVK